MYRDPDAEAGDVKTFTFDFLAGTSAHGLPKIATASGNFRRVSSTGDNAFRSIGLELPI